MSIQQNPFLQAVAQETNRTRTENGAVAYSTTANAVLDFFALGGAKRENPDEAVKLFKEAFKADKLLAVRTLFYIRDIRKGQGERDIFRSCLAWLYTNQRGYFQQVIKHIPEYGRWDDLITFYKDKNVVNMVRNQLKIDFTN